jgi:UDP-N-acetylglucosamine 2-epimerase (non-hydrolysing)
MKKAKLLLVAGARPNFMKVAPLVEAIQGRRQAAGAPGLEFCLVHTGQHYDDQMSRVFFDELGMPRPDVNLEVGSGSHAVQTANVMTRFEPVCVSEQPDWVVVVGDVNSTLACTLVATKLGLRVAHVEAGLRSFDRTMPEEINRLVTDALADLLLPPSEEADENLRREGVSPSRIRRVGNVMIDSLVRQLPKARQSGILAGLGLAARQFAYVTLHRPSNVDDQAALPVIVAELGRLATRCPVVFPIHPRTRKRLDEFSLRLDGRPGMHLLKPVGYHDSLCLAENARFVLTDSGGLQEETTYFRTPCLTLRPNTERPITITSGSNRLTRLETLAHDIEQVLAGEERFGTLPPLWDGRAAERIVQELADRL